MNKENETRLSKLTGDKQENLTYSDLCFLLKNDKKLRGLIPGILEDKDDKPPDIKPTPAAPAQPPSSVNVPAQQSLQQMLAPEWELLELVQSDAELKKDFLGDHNESDERQLVRLIAMAAQWNTVELLWDKLAARCKAKKEPATQKERGILDGCLKIYNITLTSNKATLTPVECDVKYNCEQYDRVDGKGDYIEKVLLPGIINASGLLCKKQLIVTNPPSESHLWQGFFSSK
jgi:hypothetical protein